MPTDDLQRPYWDADVYIYRVTSPQALRLRHPIPFDDLIAQPLAPAVTMEDMEEVQVQRFEHVSAGLLDVTYDRWGRVAKQRFLDSELLRLMVRAAVHEFREKTGRLYDARAFTVELMDDRQEPMVPAYPRSV